MFNAIRQCFALRRLIKQMTLVEVARSLGKYHEIQITPTNLWVVSIHSISPAYVYRVGKGLASSREAAMQAANTWTKSQLKVLATSGELK